MALLKLRNLLLLTALLVLGFLVSVVVYRYRPMTNVVGIVKALPKGIDLSLQEIRYSHTEGGVERWRLVAGRVEHRAVDKTTGVRNLQLTFFDKNGAEQGTLKAANGQVNADFSVIEVVDQVEIALPNGYRLQTSHLTFTQRDRSIRTDAPVTLTGAALSMKGVGMHLDVESKRLKILDQVHAKFQRTPAKRNNS